MSLCLEKSELIEITGRVRSDAQLRWFKRNGFIVQRRSDGMPIVSRQHFEQMMGATLSSKNTPQEPDYSSIT